MATKTCIILVVLAILALVFLALCWFKFSDVMRQNLDNYREHQSANMKSNNQQAFSCAVISPNAASDSPHILGVVSQDASTTSPQTAAKLYYFYSDKCVHCRKFQPIWEKIQQTWQASPLLTTQALDASQKQNENLMFYYNIEGTPTLILVTPTMTSEYNGAPNYESVMQFIQQSLNQ